MNEKLFWSNNFTVVNIKENHNYNIIRAIKMNQRTMKFLNDSSALLLESSKRVACDTLALLDSSIVEVFNDRALTGSCAETLRVLSAWSPKTEHDKIARSLVLLAAYRAEQSSPSSEYWLWMLYQILSFNCKIKKC